MAKKVENSLEKKLEEAARALEARGKTDMQLAEALQKVEAGTKALQVDCSEDVARSWDVLMAALKSPSEARVVAALSFLGKWAVLKDAPTSRVLELAEAYPRAVRVLRHPHFINFVATVFPKMLHRHPTSLLQSAETLAETAVEEVLRRDDRRGDERGFAYRLLGHLTEVKGYLVLKEFQKHDFRELLQVMASEKPPLQAAAEEMAWGLVRATAHLEREDQRTFLWSPVLRTLGEPATAKSPRMIELVFRTLALVFRSLSRSLFLPEDCRQVYNAVLGHLRRCAAKRQAAFWRPFCELLPEMASNNPTLFQESGALAQCIEVLLATIGEMGIRDGELAQLLFPALGRLLGLFPERSLAQQVFAKSLRLVELWARPREERASLQAVLECLRLALRFVKSVTAGREEPLNDFVDTLVIHCFGPTALDILEQLHRSPDPDFNLLLESKLRVAIAMTLKSDWAALDEDALPGSSLLPGRRSQQLFEQELEQDQLAENIRQMVDSSLSVRTGQLSGLQASPFRTKRGDNLRAFTGALERAQAEDRRRPSDAAEADRKVSVALEALVKFDFGQLSNEKRTTFIKDAVFAYLESGSVELRKIAAKLVFRLSSQRNPVHAARLSLANKTLQTVADRMISLATGDPDDSVREETLAALNQSSAGHFLPYLAREETLRQLVGLIYDANPRIQKNAILLLLKAVPHFPEILQRFDLIVFRSLSLLQQNAACLRDEVGAPVRILSTIARRAPVMLEDRIPVVVSLAMRILRQSAPRLLSENPEGPLVATVDDLVRCLETLFDIRADQSRLHFEAFVEVFLQVREGLSEALAQRFVRCLTTLTRASGRQLLWWVKYDGHRLILNGLDKNTSGKLRTLWLRLLGTVGALDPAIVQRLGALRQRGAIHPRMSLDEVAAVLLTVRKEGPWQAALQNPKSVGETVSSSVAFRGFLDSVMLANGKADPTERALSPKRPSTEPVQPDRKAPPSHPEHYSDSQLSAWASTGHRHKSFESKQGSFPRRLQADEDVSRYVARETILFLLDTLRSEASDSIITECLEALQRVVLILGKSAFEFTGLLLSAGIESFEKFRSLPHRLLILRSLKHFVRASNLEIMRGPESSTRLLDLFAAHIGTPELQPELIAICHFLVDHRALLKHCLRNVVTALVALLLAAPFAANAPLAFELLLRIDSPEYLCLITPSMVDLLTTAKSADAKQRTQLVEHVLAYFANISLTHHFRHQLGTVIRACRAVGEREAEVREPIQNFLVDLLRATKDACLDYLPLLVPFLRGLPSFAKAMRQLKERGHVEDAVPQGRLGTLRRPNPNGAHPEDQEPPAAAQPVSFDDVLAAFVAEQMAKQGMSWDDWFHRLKTELVLNSPSPVLQACANLRFHVRATDGLFLSAFLAFWAALQDSQKAQMLRGFELVLSAPSRIPPLIHRHLLGLLEVLVPDPRFGCVLDIGRVAEFAARCHCLPIAIFFKELEFAKNPECHLKPLVGFYREAGYPDAAQGLLATVQDRLSPAVRERVLLSLGAWDLQAEPETGLESPTAQIRQSVARSAWNAVIAQVGELLPAADSSPKQDPDLSRYLSMAALQLRRWDQLCRLPLRSPLDTEFYHSCLALSRDDCEDARKRVREAFSLLEKGSQVFANYAASYEQMVRLQSVVELDEILRLRRRFDCRQRDELNEYLVPPDRHSQGRSADMADLVATWGDRLEFMQPRARFLEETLAVRGLMASERASYRDLLPGYLHLAELYHHSGNEPAYRRLVGQLTLSFEGLAVPVALGLADIECGWRLGQVPLDAAIKQAAQLAQRLEVAAAERRQVFSRVGRWVAAADAGSTSAPTNFFEARLQDEQNDFELWHHFAICNYAMVKAAEAEKRDLNSKQLVNAIQGFAESLASNAPVSGQFTLQDLLRLLELWFGYQPGLTAQMQAAVEAAIKRVPTRLWLLIVRPLMTKLEASEAFLNSARPIIASLAADYPQFVLFPLLLAAKSDNKAKARLATRVLRQMEAADARLVADATLFSEELIRVSVLFDELWYNGFCEISTNRSQGRHAQAAALLASLLDRTLNGRGARTLHETSFLKRAGRHLLELQELFGQYSATQNELPLLQAWDVITCLYRDLEAAQKNETELLYLEHISPGLLGFRNSALAIPGTLRPAALRAAPVRVAHVHPTLRLLRSKRRPRKVSVTGSDQKTYSFLLKGNEDLRLDERVMQLLGLLNDLFNADSVGPRNELQIGTFTVTPLSYDSGLISWVENCDTLFDLIREHRTRVGLNVNFERVLYSQFAENFNQLAKPKKLEVYRFVAENSQADDLQRVFWQRAVSADAWLSGRHCFTSSLAVMSMVGYLVGLGDRHLMNIMVERSSSLAIHIDFGDCFESAMLREKLPERVPFRLTRVLLNAMEAARTEGTFRRVSERVMEVVRTHRDVILAVLEEFVCDPILSWKVVQDQKGEAGPPQADEDDIFSFVEKPRISAEFLRKHRSKVSMLELDSETQVNLEKLERERGVSVNEKALEALTRIKRKLVGRDFGDETLSVPAQVDRLIREAVSPDNVSQAYIGWNPFL